MLIHTFEDDSEAPVYPQRARRLRGLGTMSWAIRGR